MITKITKILNDVFGYKSFRPFQKEIILSILSQKDVLAVMPTGGGKSLCYQIPAIYNESVTVVISPLISLMKDQVQQLQQYGVPAIYLNSSLPREEYEYNIEELVSGRIKLLYVAPETLLTDRIISILKTVKPSLITIDEAHCISEWGHDFRKEYRKIVQLREIFPKVKFAAFTATATEKVRKDIVASLNLFQSEIYVSSFDRKNLFLQVEQKVNPLEQILSFLKKYPDKSGIIYCFSRKQVDSLATDLQEAGYKALPYHAGLSDTTRIENQDLFVRDEIRIIVATIAFGMGIDKSNVRFVIHHDLPKNLESYYQEIGRGGRDGLFSHCLLLYSEKDRSKIQYFINQKELTIERDIAENQLQKVMDYADYYHCRRKPLLRYFGEDYNVNNCGACDNCDSTQTKLIDLTIPAQKFMSCIKRTAEQNTAKYNLDILLGKTDVSDISLEHKNLSTYGIGKEYSEKEWQYIISQIKKAGYITEEDIPKVTETGKLVLTGKELFRGYLPSTKKQKVPLAVAAKADEKLFAKLAEIRKLIAQKSGIPPFVIFHDSTLMEMSSKKPTTSKAMLNISGVGYVKFDKYGQIFLDAITDYISGDNKTGSKTGIKISNSAYQIGEKINDGFSLLDIMQATNLRKTTILKHIKNFVESGNQIETDFIYKNWRISEEKFNDLVDNCNDKNFESIIKVRTNEDRLWYEILSELLN